MTRHQVLETLDDIAAYYAGDEAGDAALGDLAELRRTAYRAGLRAAFYLGLLWGRELSRDDLPPSGGDHPKGDPS